MAVRAINGLANLCGPTVEEAVNAQAREVGHATNFHLFGLHVLHPTLRLRRPSHCRNVTPKRAVHVRVRAGQHAQIPPEHAHLM